MKVTDENGNEYELTPVTDNQGQPEHTLLRAFEPDTVGDLVEYLQTLDPEVCVYSLAEPGDGGHLWVETRVSGDCEPGGLYVYMGERRGTDKEVG